MNCAAFRNGRQGRPHFSIVGLALFLREEPLLVEPDGRTEPRQLAIAGMVPRELREVDPAVFQSVASGSSTCDITSASRFSCPASKMRGGFPFADGSSGRW